MVKLELSDLNNGTAFIGDKFRINVKFTFEEGMDIFWSGIRLITNPPCAKELQVSKEEIFSKGNFEAGEYIREKSLLIASNIVPTIKNRNLNYILKLILRQPNPINPEDDLVISKTHDVEIKAKDSGLQAKSPKPISFSISGLNILLTKDIYKPGETIKISYSSEELKQIEVRLLQNSNLVCYCEAYGQNCSKVEELPPAIAGDARTQNFDKDFLLLKVPEVAEPTCNWLWSPSEKEQFGFRYGAYTKWSLLVIGKKKPEYGLEPIKFEVPITISSGPISVEKVGIDFFSEGNAGASSLFDGISRFQKTYKVLSIDSDIDKYKLRIKNISKEDLQGVTVKITGLQEGLFETAPILKGFNTWKKGEEKEIVYETKQNVTALISILEDNSQQTIRIQSPVAEASFF
ncbi:MAG: hypothetical protein CEE43_03820 [Promethearchaeota archaeon Loki_b32]|nr:MAG: hypothetical protein CEE43_03820 [Candidatus Lokiarchaeota archaeon Loki_b32]